MRLQTTVHTLVSFSFVHAAGSLHTVAVKANPVAKVLQVFNSLGMGAEVWSQ